MSPRGRLVCFADFDETTLLAVLFLLTLHNCVLKVCLPTLYAVVLKFFLPLTTSAISGAAISNKSAPTRFAGRTINLRNIGIAFLPIVFANASNPRPHCQPKPGH